ncbi:phosphoglucomutase/phosphomannomutase [Mycoplasma haemocanis str. Illinois]|uniref:Phosphoglucomutase/phosphomannomutase n=1 Tax=Mycoplasma haemocanis (strain Illinois) TaxID=1111676 RepID=H6N8N5_MYCHN|nr:phosphomannomutase [Mycoplasma haemocanis]AEW46007.1 phosphoglucomutase/phosphomannomutase [Mycoplasma haemocanis str. Illinois]
MTRHNLVFEKWLNSPVLNKEEKDQLFKYSPQEIEKYFHEKPFEFGTAGIRREVGIAPQKFNKYTYRVLAVGYAKYLKSKSLNPKAIVGHDNRINGDVYAMEIANVLRNFGIEVWIPPKNIHISTPILSYYIRKLGLTGGINITASHNPPNYNGFKTYNNTGCQTNTEEERIIRIKTPHLSEIFDLNFEYFHDFKELPDSFVKDYFIDLIKTLPPIKQEDQKFKVLFSSHHGTSSYNMSLLASMMGFENFLEYSEECNVTWRLNEGEVSNPEEKESFNSSIKEAEKINAEYVFAHDPDGDRAAIAERQRDGSWYLFNGNEIGVLLSYFKCLYDRNLQKPYIVSTYVTGDFIQKIFPDIPIHTVLTGFKNIAGAVEEQQEKGNDLVVAYEEAIGALISPIHREKDGYQQLAFILKIISSIRPKNRRITDILDSLYKKYGYWKGFTEFYVFNDLKETKKYFDSLNNVNFGDICDYSLSKKEFNENTKILSWYIKGGGWIKFRVSGTEPKFKVYYNIYGDSKEWIEEQANKLRFYFEKLFKI